MGTQLVVDRPDVAQCILGIDPGLNTTGYAVICRNSGTLSLIEAGIVRSRAKDTLPERLREISRGIREVIAAHPIDAISLEQLFSHYERPRTAILMGHARGVICLAAGESDIPISHYEPNRVKKVITGNGHASKSQMQLAVKLQLSLPSLPEPADVADAMAIALVGHYLAGNPLAKLLA